MESLLFDASARLVTMAKMARLMGGEGERPRKSLLMTRSILISDQSYCIAPRKVSGTKDLVQGVSETRNKNDLTGCN